MATFSRNVTVNWEGPIMEGKGTAKAGSGAFNLPVSFPRRIGDAEGVTSPEELMAASHAACYAMVLAGMLAKNNVSVKSTSLTCTITADKSDAGIKLTTSQPEVAVEGLTAMDAATFEAKAKEAEKNCPISNALRPALAIEVV